MLMMSNDGDVHVHKKRRLRRRWPVVTRDPELCAADSSSEILPKPRLLPTGFQKRKQYGVLKQVPAAVPQSPWHEPRHEHGWYADHSNHYPKSSS